MSEYRARTDWSRESTSDKDFLALRYSRVHAWTFDNGATIRASSAPSSVPAPMSDPSAVDPEEAFVVSLSSCHMLWFLSIAAKAGFVVDRYEDEATGTLAKNPEGKLAMTRVLLRPRVAFSGSKTPSPEEIRALHHEAHERCFLASSVKTVIDVEPA
jgi:organic hydroperoxide reductase OsmC/OhrA